jgi:hypothetical protein
MRYLFYQLISTWMLGWAVNLAAAPLLHFDRESYLVVPGQQFQVQIFLDADDRIVGDQILAAGLFSYGVMITFDNTGAEVPSSSAIKAPAELDYNGFEQGALKAVGAGFAAVKGTINMNNFQPYFGTLISSISITITAAPMSTFPLAMQIYRTTGPNEDVFNDFNGVKLDDNMEIMPSNVTVGFPLELHRGWNLISIPVLNSTSVNDLFGDRIVGGAWGWDGLQLEAVESLLPKSGYWVYSAVETTVPIAGSAAADLTIPLFSGWNLIGPVANPPYSPLAFSGVFNNAYQQPIWSWQHSRFKAATQLFPGHGYWVYRGL